MGNNIETLANLKIKSFKKRSDIPILKDIPVVMINKYWIEVLHEYQEDILNIGYEILDEDDYIVATVIDIVDNNALLLLDRKINYFEAVMFGITMDRIVFDQEQRWLTCTL